MASVSIRVSNTKAGEPRYYVRYRTGGRRSAVQHGGTFRDRSEAEARVRLIRAQLAAGAPVRFTDLPAPLAYRWIYFVRMGITGPIKIGSAVNVDRRIRQLQTANPYTLWLMAKVPWVEGEERRLQESFAHAQLSGEWFRPVPELVAHVAALSGENDQGAPSNTIPAGGVA